MSLDEIVEAGDREAGESIAPKWVRRIPQNSYYYRRRIFTARSTTGLETDVKRSLAIVRV